ncbi:MAG TPA: metallopeptidase family protein [Polyangiaceae bacterium]|jgi:predicted Zn-dependent protease with MMP-like domain
MATKSPPADAELSEQLADFLDELEEVIGTDPKAALELVESVDESFALHPIIRLARAQVVWANQDLPGARALLDELLQDEPDFSDAHYALAGVLTELDESDPRRITHLLKVREIDARDDAEDDFDVKTFEPGIRAAAEHTLAELPAPYKQALHGLPILLEERPSKPLVEDGFDPRALCCFDGPAQEDRLVDDVPAPSRIVLFTANLSGEFEDETELEEEVRSALLQEVGQYFGVEDEDLEQLGLD